MTQLLLAICTIIVLAIPIGCILLIGWLDAPWVMEKSFRYRIYKVHGDMWHPWKYRLQKRGLSLVCWDIAHNEPDCTKGSNRYNEWVEKYKLRE